MQQQRRCILLVVMVAVLASSVCGRPQTGLQAAGRRLLNNPIYTESTKIVGPEKPKWTYFDAPAPAVKYYDTKVRSEKPYLEIQHNVSKVVEGKGGVTVDTWQGAQMNYTKGKGESFSFASGKRAVAIRDGSTYSYAMPQTVIAAGGSVPLAVDHVVGYDFPGANSTGVFTTGSGPTFNNQYNLTMGPGQIPQIWSLGKGKGKGRKLMSVGDRV